MDRQAASRKGTDRRRQDGSKRSELFRPRASRRRLRGHVRLYVSLLRPRLIPGPVSHSGFGSFLCALPPKLRPQWAETYTRLSSPTTLLITLQWPLDGDRRGGPPYSVGSRDNPNEIYQQLLGHDWEMCYSRAIRDEENREIGYDTSAEKGRERIAIWKRRETTSKI